MSPVARLARPAAASLVAAGAAYLLQGFIRRPSWRANLAWVAQSWWQPAGREARWQQAAGEAVDPWDRLLHGRGAVRRGRSRRMTQPAPAVGR